MKRFFALIALSSLLFAGCANGQNVEEKTAQFKSQVEEMVNTFNTEYSALKANAELSAEALDEAVDSLYDATIESLEDLCLSTIRKNRNNALGLEAFKTYFSEVNPDAEDAQKVLASLGKKVKEDESVKKISAFIDASLSTKEGCMFTDFEVDGVKFSDYIGKGKYTLVDFWASWCGPCKREIPNIAKVYNTYKGENFDVLSVAVWDKPEDTAAAAAEHGVVWNQIVNAQRIPTDIYGIQGIPQIMLFGPDGTILKRDLRGDDIEEAVREALGR